MVTDFPELPPPTDRFSDLTEAERLVVRAFRRWLAGGEHREMLWRSLAYELDPGAARDAMKGLEATIRVLTAHACRNIAYHHPCCISLGADEAGLLTLVTAVQREQRELARIVGSTFVLPDGLKVLLAAADMFASALKRARMELPLRYAFTSHDPGEGQAESPSPHTVH
jgi:hypothetical protein